jgi:hypothetical protein
MDNLCERCEARFARLIDDLPEPIFKERKDEGEWKHRYLRGFEALRLCRATRTDVHVAIGYARGWEQAIVLAISSVPLVEPV